MKELMNRLNLMDCMEGMGHFPDKYFELAIVDPPYGIDKKISTCSKKRSKGNNFALMYSKKRWDKKRPNKKYFEELFRISKNQIICGANYFVENLPVSRGWIFWDKMGDNLTVVNDELIFTSFDISIKKFKRCHGLDKGFMNKEGKNIHPTQKPVALYRWLLQNYAKPGDKILDTHVGSGSSLIACWEEGFEYCGFEIDEDYYIAACNRIETVQAQGKLFATV